MKNFTELFNETFKLVSVFDSRLKHHESCGNVIHHFLLVDGEPVIVHSNFLPCDPKVLLSAKFPPAGFVLSASQRETLELGIFDYLRGVL